jgi:uncharacterized membrane protein
MVTRSELKDRALNSLEGKWGSAAIFTLVYYVIIGLCGGFSTFIQDPSNPGPGTGVSSLLAVLVELPLAWGFTVYFLDLVRQKPVSMGYLARGFSDYVRIFLTILLMGIYICLWTLLLIVPGVIKAYSYSMTYYILKDNPELSYDAAINKSMEMMRGHKMELFLLDLSFLGWWILSILTLGIGFLFLNPYYQTTRSHFYEELKN